MHFFFFAKNAHAVLLWYNLNLITFTAQVQQKTCLQDLICWLPSYHLYFISVGFGYGRVCVASDTTHMLEYMKILSRNNTTIVIIQEGFDRL